MEELLTPHRLPPVGDSGLDLKLGGRLGAKLYYKLCGLSPWNLVEKVNASKEDFPSHFVQILARIGERKIEAFP